MLPLVQKYGGEILVGARRGRSAEQRDRDPFCRHRHSLGALERPRLSAGEGASAERHVTRTDGGGSGVRASRVTLALVHRTPIAIVRRSPR